MLRGEAIVWLYSLIVYETISMIQQDLLTHDIQQLATTYKTNLFSHTSYSGKSDLLDLPHPKKCHVYRCDLL
jgi:hypothetical protein